MKLRNKKTGKSYIVHIGTSEIGNIHLAADDYITKQVLVYETLAELNEEWEDYRPSEPTIHEAKPSKWFGTLTEEERTRIARKADELQAKNLGSQS